jgi:hypothetical protein
VFVKTVSAVAAAIALALPIDACAADDTSAGDLAQAREQIRRMKEEFEARILALEMRVQQAEAKAERAIAQATGAAVPGAGVASAVPVAPAQPSPAARGSAAAANAFNPAISVTLAGTYARLSQDPSQYRIQGFVPGGDESGPGSRSFNLGESEITLSANIDHRFSGQLTFSMDAGNQLGVEEAFVRANALAEGVNATAGRMLSAVGYLNGQHAHAWDFVDAPLAYQAFFGGQYKNDGVQLKWLAPLDRFVELGLEVGRGSAFPGTDRNKNGANSIAAFAHMGDDIGASGSWRLGLSYLRTGAAGRTFDDIDRAGATVTDAFTGNSRIWIADAIYKWAPDGNATQRNFKLQGEYFRRTERGTLTYDTLGQSLGSLAGDYRSTQSGWYVQGVYQFMPNWRAGLRYDRLGSGSYSLSTIGSGDLDPADFARLLSYNPSRATAMVDYSPSEFSRFRVQLAKDKSRPGAADNQIFLQYIMSLGAHGAHTF